MLKYLWLIFLAFPSFAETDFSQEENTEIMEETHEYATKHAKIQILNKITAKAKYVEVNVGDQITFATMKIKISKCLKSSPFELSENKILMEISELKNGQTNYQVLFNGWMFSSSPAISSLEHAVYDVVAIECY